MRNKMDSVGLDMLLDIHGDEELPYNFINGNEVRLALLTMWNKAFPCLSCSINGFWLSFAHVAWAGVNCFHR